MLPDAPVIAAAPVLAAATVLADAPMHALPWYFGLAFFSTWAAAAVGMALLVRRRLRARAERRIAVRHRSSDDRSLPS